MAARGRDKAEWNRLSALIATIENANKVKGKAVQPSERTPYGQQQVSGAGKMPLRRENLHILKQLAMGRQR